MKSRATTTLPCTQLTVAEGNYMLGRSGTPIDGVVMHTMVGTVASANSRFNTVGTEVSATYGIGLDGKLYQWCDEDNTAYANGNWQANLSKISFEHEDRGDYNNVNNTRTDALYKSSAALLNEICLFYDIPLNRDHVKLHREVSSIGTACPDSLDVDRIIREALALRTQQNTNPGFIEEPVAQRDMLVTKATNWDNTVDYISKIGYIPPEAKTSPTGHEDAIAAVKQLQTARDLAVSDLKKCQETPATPVPVSTPTPQLSDPPVLENSQNQQANPKPLPSGQNVYLELLGYLKAWFWKLPAPSLVKEGN